MAGTDTSDDTPTKFYELLDSGMNVRGRMLKFGAKVELTEDQAEFLERYGSVRPWGEDDHDLVDDERDLPGILASAKGREDLARRRIAKRGDGKAEQETSPAREQLAQLTATRTGPDPVLAPTADQEKPEQVQHEQRDGDDEPPARRTRERGRATTPAADGGQEQSPGRRG